MSKELERLTNEYDAVLIQYKKAKADISAAISGSESGSESGTKRQIVKGQQVIGGQALGETDAKSAQDCSAICASDEKCTGATYKGTLGKCATFSGANLDATPSANNEDYAIYNANLKLAKSLNRKLVELNRQIKTLSKGTLDFEDIDESELNMEEELLNVELQKRDDMSSAIQETTIQTTMNQYWYWILIAGIGLLICVLIYIFASSSKSSGPSAPDRFSSNSNSSRPSSSSNDFLSRLQRPSSSSSSSSYPSWSSGGSLLKPGKLKYEAFIPAAVMLAATLTATQLQRFFYL